MKRVCCVQQMSDLAGPHHQVEPSSEEQVLSSAEGKAEAIPLGSANPFEQFTGIIPPLPGGSVAFVRELRGQDDELALSLVTSPRLDRDAE